MKDLSELRGVGNATLKRLNRLGIESVPQLLKHYPRRYQDFSNIEKISDVEPGYATVRGKFESITERYVRRGLHITNATIYDGSGSLRITWFNQPYKKRQLKTNKTYFLSGELKFSSNSYQITNPDIEPVEKDNVHTARILAVYPETKGLNSKKIRTLVDNALKLPIELEGDVPDEVARASGFSSYRAALERIHQPDSIHQAEEARRRLAFGELFALSLAGLMSRSANDKAESVPISFHENATRSFVNGLPFELTSDQKRSAWDILQDMTKQKPMNRLLDGDVGSGKTVVAAMAVFNAFLSKKQSAVIAPTTILAKQHLESFSRLLGDQLNIELMVSATTAKEKKRLKSELRDGKIDLFIGTHSLFQPDVEYANLGLLVIDEQHRFGVEQRRKLQARLGLMPHVLTMSATPIPRSLALTLYGELDISLIKQMPPGRKKTITQIHSASGRKTVDELITSELEKGRQAFVVCPLISESETLPATSAEEAYERYRKAFSKRNVELIHGRMSDNDKNKLMSKFNEGKIDILVATSVVEVGVNVSNASLMVVESAERFGLAQLHQLRGRVGRSSHQAYCVLITTTPQRPPRRLQAMSTTNDGFKLAELDLELRGPGAIYGTRQHGSLDMRLADFSDVELVSKAKEAANKFHESKPDLLQYPQLAETVKRFRAITHLN